jgi:hypothetical protein
MRFIPLTYSIINRKIIHILFINMPCIRGSAFRYAGHHFAILPDPANASGWLILPIPNGEKSVS